MAREGFVHGLFNSGSSVLCGDITYGMSGHTVLRIGAYIGSVVLLYALCESYSVGRNNGSTLNMCAFGNGVVVGGERLNMRCIDGHQIGKIAEKNGKKDGKNRNQ